jgi:hypothetical protein
MGEGRGGVVAPAAWQPYRPLQPPSTQHSPCTPPAPSPQPPAPSPQAPAPIPQAPSPIPQPPAPSPPTVRQLVDAYGHGARLLHVELLQRHVVAHQLAHAGGKLARPARAGGRAGLGASRAARRGALWPGAATLRRGMPGGCGGA